MNYDLFQVVSNVRVYFQMAVLLEAVGNEMQVLLVNVWCDIGMTLSGKCLLRTAGKQSISDNSFAEEIVLNF